MKLAGANARLFFSDFQKSVLTRTDSHTTLGSQEQRVNIMRQTLNEDDRAVLVLEREARRVSEAAERVRLVVQAMALRRRLIDPRQVACERVDLV